MNDFAQIHSSRLTAIRGGLDPDAPGQGTPHKHHSRAGGFFALGAMAISALGVIGIIWLCITALAAHQAHDKAEFFKAQRAERARLEAASTAGRP